MNIFTLFNLLWYEDPAFFSYNVVVASLFSPYLTGNREYATAYFFAFTYAHRQAASTMITFIFFHSMNSLYFWTYFVVHRSILMR